MKSLNGKYNSIVLPEPMPHPPCDPTMQMRRSLSTGAPPPTARPFPPRPTQSASLAGGDGADTYGFGSGWGQDTIEDYSIGEDRIDFSGTGLRLEDLFITTADGNTYLSDGENTLTLAGVDGVEQALDETFLLF